MTKWNSNDVALFLDIDGVLATAKSYYDRHGARDYSEDMTEEEAAEWHIEEMQATLDGDCLKQFARVKETVPFVTVLSSSWRKLDWGYSALLRAGIVTPETICTTSCSFGNKPMIEYFAKQGLGDISEYTRGQPGRGYEVEYTCHVYGITKFVIIDDESDFTEAQKPWLLQTSFGIDGTDILDVAGLTKDKADELIELIEKARALP